MNIKTAYNKWAEQYDTNENKTDFFNYINIFDKDRFTILTGNI